MYNKDDGYIQSLRHISHVAMSVLTREESLTSISRHTARAMKAAGCAIMALSPHKKHLSVIAAFGLSDRYLRKGALNVSKSFSEIMDGKIVTISDITQDKRAEYPEAAKLENIRSLIGIPISVNSQIAGEIRVYFEDSRKFSSSDKDFITVVSNFISIVMRKPGEKQAKDPDTEHSAVTETATSTFIRSPSLTTGSSNFSHKSEEEFARLLDFYQIEWLYEPRSFPLSWKDDRVTEMFTPDFYLPELDLYIEITTLKQSLITEKNRKLRRVRELYPEANVRLLNKNDYTKLLAKYGYGPLGATKLEGISNILFTRAQIIKRTRTLAKQISSDYAGAPIVLVGVLKGVICFLSDLMREISLPLSVELMAVSYFGNESEKEAKITKDIDTSIKGMNVIMVEDIVDTGMTLNYVLNHLLSLEPSSLRVCTLLDKKARRLIDVPLDYIGFEIPDEFVVGYGLDHHGKYRNLPYVAVLHPNTDVK